MTDQGVGDALIAIEEGQIEGEVSLVITLVQFLWKLSSVHNNEHVMIIHVYTGQL